jgi:hypothetical protein
MLRDLVKKLLHYFQAYQPIDGSGINKNEATPEWISLIIF